MSANPFAKFNLGTATQTSAKSSPVFRYRKTFIAAIEQQIAMVTSTNQRGAWFRPVPGGYEVSVRYCKQRLHLNADFDALTVANIEDVVEVLDVVIQQVQTGYFDDQLVELAGNTTKSLQNAGAAPVPAGVLRQLSAQKRSIV